MEVAAPVWTTYYTFEREELLAAGTRLRVFSGNVSDAPVVEPGLLGRFAAALDERGRIRFSSLEGADLRLVMPRTGWGHRRLFLPDSAYSPVAARVMRKADGTGLFVTVPQAAAPGTRLAEGQYRLQLTYVRDNKASDPGSQIFRQAGNSSPESVSLDIPWQEH